MYVLFLEEVSFAEPNVAKAGEIYWVTISGYHGGYAAFVMRDATTFHDRKHCVGSISLSPYENYSSPKYIVSSSRTLLQEMWSRTQGVEALPDESPEDTFYRAGGKMALVVYERFRAQSSPFESVSLDTLDLLPNSAEL